MITKPQILRALEVVKLDPTRLSDILIEENNITFSIHIAPSEAVVYEKIRLDAVKALEGLPNVGKTRISLTAEKAPAKPTAQHPNTIAGVKHVIAVASGKGGVGKSTTACNLVIALANMGLKVGILDADIYGPSQPKLFGLHGKPQVVSGRTLKPLEGYGVKVMSIGFMVDEETPMIWRGPMVQSAITQMLKDVAWGELDVLVVDMPPGTGDAQLTMAQQTPLAGAVIVSTPQDLALIDARRGVASSKKPKCQF
jgi:ATP-binding protein involved in chromosome partitioning